MPFPRTLYATIFSVCLAAFTVTGAEAGFVMGSSAGSQNSGSAPVVSTPSEDGGMMPEYDAIESETLQTPDVRGLQAGSVSAAPVDEESPEEQAKRRKWVPPVIEPPTHVESYRTEDGDDHSAALKPAPVPMPERSIDMPKDDPVLKVKRMGNLPVTKPETRAPMMDSTPDDMPYVSGYDVMKKPIDEPPAKSWNDGALQEQKPQMQTRRISQEVQSEQKGVFIDPFPDKRVSKNAAQDEIISTPQNVLINTPALEAASANTQNFNDAVGFASDIPLALALSQVVPPEYAYSFSKDVNPGYRVSWNGGKPWNQVVEEMVAPLNLSSEIRGNMVLIRQSTARTGAVEVQPTEKVAVAAPQGSSVPSTETDDEFSDRAPKNLEAPEDMAKAEPLKADDVAAIAPAAGTPEKAETPTPVITERKAKLPDQISAADVLMPPEPFSQPLERVEVKSKDAPKDEPIEKVVEVAPVPAVPHSLNKDLKAEDILKPMPSASAPAQKIASAQDVKLKSNTDLGLPPSQPRRSQVKDPGELASEQPPQAAKAVEKAKEAMPVAEAAPPVIEAVDNAQSEKQSRIWEAKQGDSLKKILNDWSTQANVDLEWDAAHDYALSSNVFINGTYNNAIKILFTHGFDKGKAPAHKLFDANGTNTLMVKDNPA